jgi:hypothetical protein
VSDQNWSINTANIALLGCQTVGVIYCNTMQEVGVFEIFLKTLQNTHPLASVLPNN